VAIKRRPSVARMFLMLTQPLAIREKMRRNDKPEKRRAHDLPALSFTVPTLVVYSAKDGQVAADDVDGVSSPFARAFVAELKVPGLEVRRLLDDVRDDVLDATNNQQPLTYGSLAGRRDFFFVAKR
jgi:hypothetical protein